MTPTAAIEKLETRKLKVGEPVILQIKYAEGKPCNSQWNGDQVMYTLIPSDNAPWTLMFTDPYVADRISALGIQPRTPFQLCKKESLQGNRRTAEVVVSPLKNAGANTPTPARGIGNFSSYATPTAAPPQVSLAPEPPPAPVNGAGDTHAAIMARCYCSAVDIALATIACAEKKGLRLTVQFEDIRAMGTALLIAETGRR